jgi:hypothetical protein
MSTAGNRALLYSESGSALVALTLLGSELFRTEIEVGSRKPIKAAALFRSGDVAVTDGISLWTAPAGSTRLVKSAASFTSPVTALAAKPGGGIFAATEAGSIYFLSPRGVQVQAVAGAGKVRLLRATDNYLAVAGADRVDTFKLQSGSRPNRKGWIAIGFGISGLLGLVWIPFTGRIPEKEERAQSAPQPAALEALPDPVPPDELVQLCAAGSCGLFAGTGLSLGAKVPGVPELARAVLEQGSNSIPRNILGNLKASCEAGQYEVVIDRMASLSPETLERSVSALFLDKRLKASTMHEILGRIKFCCVVTMSLDDLIEKTYPNLPVYASGTSADAKEAFAKHIPFILKLRGRPGEKLAITSLQYRDLLNNNLPFAQLLEGIVASRSMFFTGTNMETIGEFLQQSAPLGSPSVPHFALVWAPNQAWQSSAELLHEKFNVTVLPFSRLDQMERFARQLQSRVSSESGGVTVRDARLRSISIQNIGPFDDLTVPLDLKWNVLLGDNGVGKTTILKAIAVAILGSDSRAFAGRLIKVDKDSGTITLETVDGRQYATILRRTDKDPEIRSSPTRYMDAEGLLALGFPPLRTVSWKRVEAAQIETRSRVLPDDLLPVVTGDVDPRADSLKQWLVSLDYEIRKGRKEYSTLIQRFFEFAIKLAPAFKVGYDGVSKDNQVMVKTDDGLVPLEALSQGTNALLSWIAILMQRLYSFYDSKDRDPTRQPALVLIDEIDAHMHPAWQYGLVQMLSELFPEIQFVATTHSPLIVGGLPVNQVKKFVRINGRPQMAPLEQDMTMGRADQLLTSRLFGLPTTVDPVTKTQQKRYEYLLGKERSEQEDAEFHNLGRILQIRIPSPGETPVREAQKLIDALLDEQLSDLPEARDRISEAARRYLEEIDATRSKQSKVRS